jgi:GT2 family glycosyltransferase
MLLDWEAIREVGLFDERFFLYAEETDWQRRARRLGWSTRLCAQATAHHLGAGSSIDPARREALFHSAQETYIRKWFGLGGWETYRWAVITGAILRSAVLSGERRAQARRRARIYRVGPRVFAGMPAS